MTNWLVIREGDPLQEGNQVPQFTTRLRQLRTMLHLVDADGPHVDPRRELVRQRRLLTQGVLLNRVRQDPKSSLRRTLCAATARTCDALVREEIADVSDVVIAAAAHVSHLDDLKTMAEASMVPEIESALRAYGRLLQATRTAQRDGHGLVAAADSLKAIGSEPSGRALRQDRSVSPGPLVSGAWTPVSGRIQLALRNLRTLVRDTIGHPRTRRRDPGPTRSRITSTLGRRARRRASRLRRRDLDHGARGRACASHLRLRNRPGLRKRRQRGGPRSPRRLRRAHASAAQTSVLASAGMVPGERRASCLSSSTPMHRSPRGRLRAASSAGSISCGPSGPGAVGSVFIARRVEEREDETAPLFALKVPDYSAGRGAHALRRRIPAALSRGSGCSPRAARAPQHRALRHVRRRRRSQAHLGHGVGRGAQSRAHVGDGRPVAEPRPGSASRHRSGARCDASGRRGSPRRQAFQYHRLQCERDHRRRATTQAHARRLWAGGSPPPTRVRHGELRVARDLGSGRQFAGASRGRVRLRLFDLRSLHREDVVRRKWRSRHDSPNTPRTTGTRRRCGHCSTVQRPTSSAR